MEGLVEMVASQVTPEMTGASTAGKKEHSGKGNCPTMHRLRVLEEQN